MTRRNDPKGPVKRLSAMSAAVRTAVITGIAITPGAAMAQEAIDLSKWSPEYVRSIAGTGKFDTAAECAKTVPLDYTGRVSVWYTGPADAEPEITKKFDKEFWEAFKATYPNITV